MKFYLSLLIYTVTAIFFSCSKSQSLNCSVENYIQSSHYNSSNGMKNQQRNMKSIYTLKDWDQQYLDTKYSCKEIITQFFYCIQRINVGSKYFIFLKIENPVPVNPDTDSKIEFKNVTW